MPVSFADLVQACAPFIATETLAGVISLESRFAPLNIRINSGLISVKQPTTLAQAIETATALAAERHDIKLGLGGIGLDDLDKLNLSISDAFDPCLNLKATATLLDGYYRVAINSGSDKYRAEQIMLQSFYGRGDPSIGALVNYDDQVRRAIERSKSAIATLTIGHLVEINSNEADPRSEGRLLEDPAENFPHATQPDAKVPSWDVFNARQRSSILVFQNKNGEE
ncbi:lytic transglycosylase domain-containing protein [Shinella sp.]|uniref:lytic transglycosylase domain-containing protein n=1 Tax=Shinella sp. TaxID=1870904 RepID=UPI002896B3DB|nr:lytic transglycosylase domain-containing protein [Shinella sp.]